jgi:hypothetical protein
MVTNNQVLFSSPANKQPELALAGLIFGFAAQVPAAQISLIVPNPLGSTAKVRLVHTVTACPQSLAVTGPPPPPQVTQLKVADQPGAVIITSEVNTNVKQPVVEVTVPGPAVPV